MSSNFGRKSDRWHSRQNSVLHNIRVISQCWHRRRANINPALDQSIVQVSLTTEMQRGFTWATSMCGECVLVLPSYSPVSHWLGNVSVYCALVQCGAIVYDTSNKSHIICTQKNRNIFLLSLQPCRNVKNLREVYSGWRKVAIWSGGSCNDPQCLKSLFYYSIYT